MNEKSAGIPKIEQDIFVLFSKWKRWKRL